MKLVRTQDSDLVTSLILTGSAICRAHQSIKILVVQGNKILYKGLSSSNGGAVISISSVY